MHTAPSFPLRTRDTTLCLWDWPLHDSKSPKEIIQKKEEDLKQEIKETLEFLNLARDVAGEGVSCELPSGAGSPISRWSKQ